MLFSTTKNLEALNKQTHGKAEETLEFKTTKPKEIFFRTPISIEGSWLIRLISREVYNYIINIKYQKSKFELYTDTFDEFSFEELGGELEEIIVISIFSDEHLQYEIKGPCIISAYKKLETEKRWTDGYYIFSLVYARSTIRDFESYLGIVVGLDDIQLILKQCISNFVT